MTSEEHRETSGRRGFLNAVLGGSATGLLAAVVYPILRFVLPPAVGEAAVNSVVAARVGDLTPDSGKVFRFGSKPGLLLMTPAGEYRAFLAVCTHLNCTVGYRPEHQDIHCACHLGKFDLDGNVVSGPPPRPLTRFVVETRDALLVVAQQGVDIDEKLNPKPPAPGAVTG